ncbi:MAG: potassium-transporting ATPase subunit KdpC [Microscillaceae bacterium]|nr:potassium-transporting ATPase subunit KdpC [Microscillaceae bacterium]
MKTLKSSLILSIITLIIFGVLYPVLIFGIGNLFPQAAQGFPLRKDGKLVGFENIGQPFSTPKYFWGRPSAVDYNAAATGGSNKANDNPDYLQLLQSRADTLLKYHPEWEKSEIPVEIVTASGGGLDPHISQRAALMQVKRVAKARSISENQLIELIKQNTQRAFLGLLGPDHIVNVLKLNLALDQLK